ncbi:TetR/AcrR family transcriptional regulator [Bradyrhizobium sp. U87765 SZCCT0131]|nr:TetR/AcrR family transcriptional regulator [Bradyrhizobium sp. U87765 SZCCT0131]MBR1259685.1 TetR/AcrR family transcriptional regulator [Bradyrhizobium sp. U87765 SZCCT0134]MBR1305826.1 TetR/AcrR family transcriptional regulator [Bradyrhizobium sp. U87765 SZCCT0110]MBR1322193.1 TetR/AcrR family transcriptional regulator [Bradyrhizobium sp. U87765 SZCCT0109]MBR1350528.1 TetR/AcrR family transcriptional regulator [Bradyrhizobium sp. U87765 SZCCT0048]
MLVNAETADVDELSARGQQLRDIARDLIAAKGLRALKVRDVAAAAGCAVGSVYLEFADLDGLVLAVSRQTVRRLRERMAAIADPDPVRQLHALGAAYLDFATDHPNLLRALFEHRMVDDRPFPQDLLDRVQDTFALLYPPLAALLPDAPADAVALLARTMFSAVHGIVSLGLEDRLVAVPAPLLRQQVAQLVDVYVASAMRA